MSLAILVPVLRRPHRVRPLLASIRETTPDPYRVIFICDTDDDEEIEACIDHLGSGHVEVMLVKAPYARKINEAVRQTTEPLLLFAADDLKFHESWLENAKAMMSDAIGVVATNDLYQLRNQAGELATHPLVARWYAESPTIDKSPGPLCELYPHEYLDREFSEVARSRKAFAYAMTSIVEHLHPNAGKAPMDDIYAKQRARMRKGFVIYRRRRQLWLRDLQRASR